MIKKLSIVLAIFMYFTSFQVGYAVTTPNATCLNPQGTVVVQYDSGIHGIVGRLDRFEGKDTVYKSSEADMLQCFCSVSGVGIQTNWVKAGGYSADEGKILLNQGWVYVDSGKPWGLSDEPYYAKNSDFSCGGVSQGTSASMSTTVSNSGSQLAGTGNIVLLCEAFATGLVFVLLGLKLKKA